MIYKSDFVSVGPRPGTSIGHKTHKTENMPPELPERNLFLGDQVLMSLVKREGIDWIHNRATQTGEMVGSQNFCELARLANHERPVLRTHNYKGERIDFVEYHPAYHELMSKIYETEVHSLPWTSKKFRPHTARSVLYYLWNQLENGVISCPNGMSFAVAPLLKSDMDIGGQWLAGILSSDYDPRQIPAAQKNGITVAMAMTEKQGGSDLRANSTVAVPTGHEREYALTGHKFFASAPMSDIYLITAKTDAGITLFIAPRILPNGERNSIIIQRLKNKLGNNSNASSEIELDNTIAYRIGEEGRGIRQFVKYMTHYIRMALPLGSAGIMRTALTSAIHHTSHRSAFNSSIFRLPMMENTLADLAIESEAATLLGFRVSKAVDDGETSETEAALSRILIPIAKYWNCRRVGPFTLEALECHGGMGYTEDQSVARFYREAPLNSIWEGTSAIMGLDVMRSIQTVPGTLEAVLEEIRLAKGSNRYFDAYTAKLEDELTKSFDDFEHQARRMMTMIALAMQGSLLIRQSTPEISDVFCASRLGGEWGHEFGTLKPNGKSFRKIIERASIN